MFQKKGGGRLKGMAVVFTNPMQVSYEQVELPEPQDDDVVIDVMLSWISNGTESSFLRGERTGGDIPYREGNRWPFPIVAGYQKVGIIRQVGATVRRHRPELQPGDRVFCTVSRVLGMYSESGGHVNPAITRYDQVWKLPLDVDLEDYAGLVLTQVGYNCGMCAPVSTGATAVVIGDGLVGQWTAQTLVHRGAQVAALGRRDDRLRQLPEPVTGISTQNINKSDMMDAIEHTFPQGINIVVDTVGDLDAFWELYPNMKRHGAFVSAGFYGERGHIDIQRLRLKELSLHAPSGWTRDRMDATLYGIHEGWLQTSNLITHRFPVARADEAWQVILDRSSSSLGVLLEWT